MRTSEATGRSPCACEGSQDVVLEMTESLKVFISRAGPEVWSEESKPGAGRQAMMVLVRDGGEAGFGAMGKKVTFLG